MASETKLIKVGRQGVQVRNARVPASFFRHQQPGKRFVVLVEGERRLMHVRASDLDAILRAYREYAQERKGRRGTTRADTWPVAAPVSPGRWRARKDERRGPCEG